MFNAYSPRRLQPQKLHREQIKGGLLNSIKTNEEEQRSKIFIVDDHSIIRGGLTRLIDHEKDMTVIGEADNAEEAIEGIGRCSPDLAIVDISLRGMNGIELTKILIAKYPQLPILIFSMHEESLFVEKILRIGAKGYVMKRNAVFDTITAIRKVLGGGIYMSKKSSDTLMNGLLKSQSSPSDATHEVLSIREMEVLQMISDGCLTREISQKLYVSVKTIESHYANIKIKMKLKNSYKLIQYAVQSRYVHELYETNARQTATSYYV